MNRLSAEPKQRRSLPVIDQRVAAMTDFNTLPGMSEISVQRAFGTVVWISNPFFRLHETRAGARTIIEGRTYDNFSSYAYLGLNGHPEVQTAGRASAAPRARGGARRALQPTNLRRLRQRPRHDPPGRASPNGAENPSPSSRKSPM
jgi:hypothetical protein